MAVTCSGEWPCITLVLGFAEGGSSQAVESVTRGIPCLV